MNLNPITKVAAAWRELTPARQVFGAGMSGAALAGVGTYVAGRRDSIAAQTVAYASAFTLLGSAGAAIAGGVVSRSVHGTVGREVTAGIIDALAGEAKIATASQRAMRPAKLMFGGSAFLGIGVASGNSVMHRTQIDLKVRGLEDQKQVQRAHKVGSKK